jgi:hypothetical protein
LLNERGAVVIPAGERQYLKPLSPDRIQFGRMVSKQWEDFEDWGKRVQHTVERLIWGLLDGGGREIVPAVYADVGPESEGLRAFISYDKEWCLFGYLDENWNTVLTVARDATTSKGLEDYNFDKASRLFLEPVEQLLGPFTSGRAAVWIDQMTERVAQKARAGRWIDRQGNLIGGESPPPSPQSQASPDPAEQLDRLGLRLEVGLEPVAFDRQRRSVRQVFGPAWMEKLNDGTERPVLSALETVNGFFCGLHAVRDRASGKFGFIDHTGAVVVQPTLDKIGKPFRDNHTWATVGEQYVALSREMSITQSPG